MLNIRYYIVLLIGIFIALGIGMTIGISLEGKNMIENQQRNLTQQIAKNIEQLKKENQNLTNHNKKLVDDLKEFDRINKQLYQGVIHNSLQGLKVSIIEMGNSDKGTELIDFFDMAGAIVTGSIGIFNSEGISKKNVTETNEKTHILLSQASSIGYSLIEAVSTGNPPTSFDDFVEQGVIQSKIPVQGYSEYVILVGNSEDRLYSLQHSIVDEINKRRIPIVIVTYGQDIRPVFNDIDPKQQVPICVSVDSYKGQLELISILSGKDYGFLGDEPNRRKDRNSEE